MSNHQIIKALQDSMAKERNDIAEKYQNVDCIKGQLIIENARTRWAKIDCKFGHEAATKRLMPLIAEALAMADKIATAECPKYVAHPQSVWFDEHVQQSARAFQAMVAKLVRNGE